MHHLGRVLFNLQSPLMLAETRSVAGHIVEAAGAGEAAPLVMQLLTLSQQAAGFQNGCSFHN